MTNNATAGDLRRALRDLVTALEGLSARPYVGDLPAAVAEQPGLHRPFREGRRVLALADRVPAPRKCLSPWTREALEAIERHAAKEGLSALDVMAPWFPPGEWVPQTWDEKNHARVQAVIGPFRGEDAWRLMDLFYAVQAGKI